MAETDAVAKPALRFNVLVGQGGRLELAVPFAPGARLTVIVLPESESAFQELTAASQSSLSFWDHPWDDEDWNNA